MNTPIDPNKMNAVADIQPKISGRVPPDLHPLSLQQKRGNDAPWADTLKDSPALGAAKAALTRLYEDYEKIDAAAFAADQQHGTGTVVNGSNLRRALPPEIATRLAADIGKRFATTAKVFDQQLAVVAEQIEAAETVITKSLDAVPKDAMTASVESDIRQYFRGMNEETRHNRIFKAVEEGDLQITAAVLRSPFAAGLSRADAALVREAAVKRFAKDDHAKLTALQGVHAHLLGVASVYAGAVKDRTPIVRESPQQKIMNALKEEA